MTDSAQLPPHLSPHSDTDVQDPTALLSQPMEKPLVLTLKGNDGQDVNLTSSQLESWFAAIERDEMENNANNGLTPNLPLQELQRDPYFATQFVGRYGIKTAKDVIAFLKSPAGDSVKIMIGEELAQVAALEEFKRQEYQTHEIRQHRLLAFLLLGLLYREAHARHVVEANTQQAEARVQQGEANISQEQQRAREQRTAALNQSLNSFNNTAAAIESRLSQKELELDSVQRELQAINPEEMAMRYETFDRHLGELEIQFQLPELNIDEQIASLEAQKTALEAQLQTQTPDALESALVDPNAPPQRLDSGSGNLKDRIAELSERIHALKQQKIASASAHIPQIEDKIKALSDKLESQLDDMQQLIESGKDDEARKILLEHNGLHLQIAGLKDMVGVLKGEKVLYKDDGQVAKSFDEAAFVLPLDKKVVKQNDKYYLIGAKQDLSTMEEHDLLQAQKDFERARPEISNLKLLVKHNHGLENERLQQVQDKSKSLHNDIMTLRNQLTQIQAARSEVVAEMQKLDPSMTPESLIRPTIPTPTPSSNPVNSVGKPAPQTPHATQVYKMLYEIIQRLPPAPKDAAAQLEKEMEDMHKAKGKPMSEKVRDMLKKAILDPLRAGTPIPKIPMDTLIRCMPYFGVDPEKPNVMPPTPTSQANKPETPTPFSTTLKM
ncbi:hypothetical protein DIZ81_00380 [Legionella taurinensis]|uniref:LidA long coiled-coil domain-containing protein n=1 Tax=Legionella taurinensis TaxID=70611 RepID=A0A3A5LLW8_9GAMM|nr:hypothetical protein [Legionella taurinensis]MDX1836669.1 hypothetical protein [Legionella taurinensis]PUT42876.1 hypothetical protein DB744_00385 [Legionella taurinensis]PUT45431.1 hypothetical protein DB746_00385 [Legionella taurinensis]PUT46994.1 hypothetical protein DB743_03615 [Legionella taurinensis]PUT49198.1 hypothetical protein DB745_00385 [Legionella taurinensis]